MYPLVILAGSARSPYGENISTLYVTHRDSYFRLVFATSANVGQKNIEDFMVATFFCNQPHIVSFQRETCTSIWEQTCWLMRTDIRPPSKIGVSPLQVFEEEVFCWKTIKIKNYVLSIYFRDIIVYLQI